MKKAKEFWVEGSGVTNYLSLPQVLQIPMTNAERIMVQELELHAFVTVGQGVTICREW
jgi:hypothetical protein